MIYSLKTPCLLQFLSCVTNVVQDKVRSEAAALNEALAAASAKPSPGSSSTNS